jgi:hypothetical protein
MSQPIKYKKKYYHAYWNAPSTFKSIFVAIHSKSLFDANLIVLLWSLNFFIFRLKKSATENSLAAVPKNQNVKLNIYYFIGNFDFFPLISPGDIVSINNSSYRNHCDPSDNVCLDLQN